MHDLSRKLKALSRMTVDRGCTTAEAAAAQAKLSELRNRRNRENADADAKL